MKNLKTKSILACAVLASVLGMGAEAATIETALSVNQKINFGNYWQSYKGSGSTSNKANYNKDPITWKVLSNNQDGTVTLLSDKVLYGDQFDSEPYSKLLDCKPWSASNVRKNLNERESGFAGDAFTDIEYAMIKEKNYDVVAIVRNTFRYSYESKLYLLSYYDVNSGGDWRAKPTDFAKGVKVYNNTKSLNVPNDYVTWWLRTPYWSVYDDVQTYVEPGGLRNWPKYEPGITEHNMNECYGVRPAMDLNLSSLLYTSAATDGKSGALETPGIVVKFKDMTATGFDGIVDVTLQDTSNTYTSVITASTLALDGSNVKMTLSGGTMTDVNHFASALFTAADASDAAYVVIQKGGGALNGEKTINVGGALAPGKGYGLQFANEYALGGSIYFATTTDVPGTFIVTDTNNVNYILASEGTFATVTAGANNPIIVADGGTLNLTQSGSRVANITFRKGGSLNVDGEKIKTTAAIKDITSAKVENDAKLFIDNAEPETEYIILEGNGITSGWLKDNVFVSGLIKDLQIDCQDTYFKVITGELGFDVMDTVMYNVGEGIAVGGSSKAIEVLKALVNNPVAAQQAANVNAYANLAENLGVTRGAYDVANMVGDAVDSHWDNNPSGSVEPPPLTGRHSGDVWAVGTRNKETVDGMKLGGMDAQYDAHYNGVVVGADLSKGFGIALNYADGNVSNYLGGHNDSEYYGASLYGRKVWGNFSLNMDAGYTYGKNELAQNGIEADAKTDTISAGLTAKYLAKAGKYDKIGLFAGARYMHIDGRDYTDSLGVNREADKINSVVVPVGLEYTGEFKMAKSAWTFKPVVAVGYLFNLGDRENDMTMRYGGAEDIFGYDFVDKGAFFTHAGMDFEKKNFTLGISYDFMKSKNSKNNRWNVNANLAF